MRIYRNIPWAPEDDDLLAALYDGGVSYGQIATTLKRTPGSIRSRLRLLGLSITPRVPDRWLRLLRMLIWTLGETAGRARFHAYVENRVPDVWAWRDLGSWGGDAA